MAETNEKRFCPSYKWGQTDTHVILTLDVGEDCVETHSVSPEGLLCVTGHQPGKGVFEISLDLAAPVQANLTTVKMNPRSVQFRLPKKESDDTWKTLQKPHIPRPAQEKKDFDFYVNSDDDEASSSDDSLESDEAIDPKLRGSIARYRPNRQSTLSVQSQSDAHNT
jgi:hypothetical protein